ncbi:MAG: amidohydrolase, partial [Bacteroidota bacterium]
MQADQIYWGGKIYTIDQTFRVTEAMAIQNGKILAVGSSDEIKAIPSKEQINLKGAYVYPGFLDPHCHIHRYAISLGEADLRDAQSWEEVLEILQVFASQTDSSWIIGRGWDQNKWEGKILPTNKDLNTLFPDRPVFLERVDIHTALVNEAAFRLSQYDLSRNRKLSGGRVIFEGDRPTGILSDDAMADILRFIPEPEGERLRELLQKAEQHLIQAGLTGVGDALLNVDEFKRLRDMQAAGLLKLPIYGMIGEHGALSETGSVPVSEFFRDQSPIKLDRLHVGAWKFFADGTFGSHTAALSAPYDDQRNTRGEFMWSYEELYNRLTELAQTDWQVNIHAIGDGATKQILDIYEAVLPEDNPRRWRIEHAQLLDEPLLQRYKDGKIIPSIQPMQATSDLPWLSHRLGDRITLAHPMRRFLYNTPSMCLPLSTDFPVERIFPIHTFYSAVTRKDPATGEGPFMLEEALTREQALKGLTYWAAFA